MQHVNSTVKEFTASKVKTYNTAHWGPADSATQQTAPQYKCVCVCVFSVLWADVCAGVVALPPLHWRYFLCDDLLSSPCHAAWFTPIYSLFILLLTTRHILCMYLQILQYAKCACTHIRYTSWTCTAYIQDVHSLPEFRCSSCFFPLKHLFAEDWTWSW